MDFPVESYSFLPGSRAILDLFAKCKRLDDRRQELCAKTFKRILKPDAHLNHLLPPLREESHELDLRNNSNFTLIKCRTERFKTSFIPAMTANFNSK